MNQQYPSMDYSRSKVEVVNAFMRGVYGWMTLGLGLTAVTAYLTSTSQAMLQLIYGNHFVLFGLMIGTIILVMVISTGINKMAPSTATGLFLLYSGLMGVMLSSVFIVYTGATLMSAFAVSAGMFGAMSLYGLVTKKDLTSWGSFLFMGLIGIVIAMVVNIFLKSAMMDFVVCCIGVLVFTGLTAYDTQRLKVMGETAPAGDTAAVRRGTILGALTLYLNFINLFLMILRLMGGGRD